ncbi:MAG: TolC family protein [Planctomycetota bacterium]|jgi:outer membrane protein TolC
MDAPVPLGGLRLVASIVVIATLGSCRNPFATHPDEYGRRVDPERLRAARTLDLDASAVPDDETLAPDGLPPPDVTGETVTVPIEQARAWTLRNNLDLQVALVDPEIARTGLSEAEAQFEAAFVASGLYSDADPSQALVFRDQFVRPFELEPGLAVPLRTGGTASVSVPVSENEAFSALDDPERYTSNVDFSISQPLLRGAGRWANTHAIRLASLESQIVEARTKLEVIRQLAAVDRAYWLLHEAVAVRAVREEQLENALEQLDRARSKLKRGVGKGIEETRALAGASRRRDAIIVARLEARDRQRVLKRIMNQPGLDVDTDTVLALSSEPDDTTYRLVPEVLLELAMRERMELLELELRIAQDLSTVDFEENQRLPLFTLDYTYRMNGADGSFGESLRDAAGVDRWSWRLGFNLEVPIGNEAAKARVHRAILVRLQRLATRAAREQAIKEEVLAALDNLELTRVRIAFARENVEFEEANFVAEQGQFRLGLRNSTEVLDAESRLADARISLIRAEVDYQVAQIDLAFATGTLLGRTRTSW